MHDGDAHDGGGVSDREAMARALALAAGARRIAAPNPWVGCVIVRDGVIVGEGATRAPGAEHAEAVALAGAGDRAHGATAYTTLEPCAHHGRTPPCADALVAAGITRVVAALEDPDPRVRGQGFATLAGAGVDVTRGTGEGEARALLAPYLHHRLTGRSFVVVKTAASIDGRTAAGDGSSQWITGDGARADAHELRADSQAIVIGSGTATADRPALTARVDHPPPRPPLRVVLDGRGRVPARGPLADTAVAPTLIVTTERAAKESVKAWLACGADVEVVANGPRGQGVDLHDVVTLLGHRGVLQALFEGGSEVAGSLVRAGLAGRIVSYVGGVTIGGDGAPVLAGAGSPTLAGAARWHLDGVHVLGPADVRIDWEPR